MEFWGHGERVANGCLEWSRGRTAGGYGQVVVDGQILYTHRYAYFLIHGTWPPSVRHTCDNPPCFEPEHLVGGTQADNARDMIERGRVYAPRHFNIERAREVRAACTAGASQRAAARWFGISQRMVGKIVRGEAWREYAEVQ